MGVIHDYAVVGGGIVGLASAAALASRDPAARILVLEKEADWGLHQTGHNSGVIHSGIYYKPGSLKARLCRAGRRSMVEFCEQHGIAHEVCGKVIVATVEAELPLLNNLLERGRQNGLGVELIGPGQLREIEPHVQGLAAIRVLDTGIADYRQVCRVLARLLQSGGSEMRLNQRVQALTIKSDHVEIGTAGECFTARRIVSCAGLHSDRIASLGAAGVTRTALQIVPFRGEYFELKPQSRHLVRHLIYPVPDPSFPFLGVHFTRMVGGQVEAGPNAVLSLAREGYRKTDLNRRDLAQLLAFPGFWRLSARYWREGLQELWRSLSKAAFVRSLQRLIPEITSADLVPAPAGIRAQAVRRDGSLVDDFHVVQDQRCVHVCNAPSPAATASLEIGRYVASLL